MASRIATLGIERPLPTVGASAPLGPSASASVALNVAEGFKAIGDYLAPVVREESIERGTAAAAEDVLSGRPLSRRPSMLASGRAYNQTAARVFAARIAGEAQIAIDEAVRLKGHDPAQLQTSLGAIRAGMESELPGEFPGARAEFLALFERQSVAALRVSGQLAAQAVIDRDKAAALEAIQTFERSVAGLALRGGTPEELGAEMAQLQGLLIQFGPRGAFTLNGEEYEQDDSRSGAISVVDIQKTILAAKEQAEILLIQGEFERTPAKGAFYRRFREQLLAGEAPIDPVKGLSLLNGMEAEIRSLEAQGRARQAAARAELRAELSAYKSGRVAGVPVNVDWEGLRERAAGDAQLLREIEIEREATTLVAASRRMSLPELNDFSAELQMRAMEAAEIGAHDAGVVQAMAQIERDRQRLLDAITAESTGLNDAKTIFEAGGDVTEETLAALRESAAGDQDVLDDIDLFASQVDAVRKLRDLPADVAEQVAEDLKAALAKSEGELGPTRRLAAISAAVDRELAMRSRLLATDPVQAAAIQGFEVPDLDLESAEGLAATIAARSPLIAAVAGDLPIDQKLLRPNEIASVDRALRGMNAETRAGLIVALGGLPEEQRDALAGQLAYVGDGFGYTSQIAAAGNSNAALAILRGQELLREKASTAPGARLVQDARISVGLDRLMLDGQARGAIEAAAIAWAVGTANGGEVDESLLEEGFQRAMFRQENGGGGLVSTDFGVIIAPPYLDRSELEALVYDVTGADLLRMNGGAPPTDSDGEAITPDDFVDATLQTVAPGQYIVRLADGSSVIGAGPGGNFLLDMAVIAERARRDRLAEQEEAAGAVVEGITEARQREIDMIREFEGRLQEREEARRRLIGERP